MSGVQRVEVARVQPAEGSTWLCSWGCLLLPPPGASHDPGCSTQAAPSTPESNPCKLPEVPILDDGRWWTRY